MLCIPISDWVDPHVMKYVCLSSAERFTYSVDILKSATCLWWQCQTWLNIKGQQIQGKYIVRKIYWALHRSAQFYPIGCISLVWTLIHHPCQSQFKLAYPLPLELRSAVWLIPPSLTQPHPFTPTHPWHLSLTDCSIF